MTTFNCYNMWYQEKLIFLQTPSIQYTKQQ